MNCTYCNGQMRVLGTFGSNANYRCRNCGMDERLPAPNQDRLIEISQSDSTTGVCLACGNEQGGVEPDAHNIPCGACGRHAVAGADHILIMFLS